MAHYLPPNHRKRFLMRTLQPQWMSHKETRPAPILQIAKSSATAKGAVSWFPCMSFPSAAMPTRRLTNDKNASCLSDTQQELLPFPRSCRVETLPTTGLSRAFAACGFYLILRKALLLVLSILPVHLWPTPTPRYRDSLTEEQTHFFFTMCVSMP